MTDVERSVEFDVTGFELVRQYSTASQTIRMWTDFREEVRERLLKLIGDADKGTFCGDTIVTVTRTRPRRFNRTAFTSDHPDLAERYVEAAEKDEIRLSIGKLPPEEPTDG